MDREPEELQYLGFVGVFGEAYKMVRSWRRLFSQIALALVLPLSALFLAHVQISAALFSKIDRAEAALDAAPSAAAQDRILSRLASDWAAFFLFKAVYLLALLILALLSTSAVVYTVAAIYTAKDLTFRKVLSVVPRVWRRLIVTFLWNFLIFFGYNTATALLVVAAVLAFGSGGVGLAVVALLLLVYAAGAVYISVVWHLASVVSVLEDACGLPAMRKSQALIRGKVWVAVALFLALNSSFVGVEVGYRRLVVDGGRLAGMGMVARVGCAAALLALLALLIVMGLVVQTVVYFVCKSYHHESIDKSSLADHLEVYLGEYVPLKGRDVQLQQYYV